MNITIRAATPTDVDAISEFNRLMAEETEDRSLDRTILRRGVSAILQDPAKGVYYVAEAEGRVVGQLMVTYEWSDWRNANFWWLQSVYVEKDVRGKGVFKQLFAHVYNLAAQRNDVCGLRLYVEQNNMRAKETYEVLGMKKAKYDMFEIDFVLE